MKKQALVTIEKDLELIIKLKSLDAYLTAIKSSLWMKDLNKLTNNKWIFYDDIVINKRPEVIKLIKKYTNLKKKNFYTI